MESIFFESWARGTGDDKMGRVVGTEVLARYWGHRSCRWSSTGRNLDSEWRWLWEDISRAPRQVQRA
jgi:hypothetical protein